MPLVPALCAMATPFRHTGPDPQNRDDSNLNRRPQAVVVRGLKAISVCLVDVLEILPFAWGVKTFPALVDGLDSFAEGWR